MLRCSSASLAMLACLTGTACQYVRPTDVACLIHSPTSQCPEGTVCGSKGFCEFPSTDAGANDGGARDAGGLRDGGAIDAGAADGGSSDGGETDAGEDDAGMTDAGMVVPVPNNAAGGPITYRRIPWGSALTPQGMPLFTVTGLASAASGDAEVVAFDGPDATSTVLGRSNVNSAGAFSLEWFTGDHPVVYVAGEDSNGALSAIVPVHNIQWVASFGGKVPGMTSPNPHRLDVALDFLLPNAPTILSPLAQDPNFTSEATAAQYADVLAPGDGNVLSASAIGALWRPVGLGSGVAPSPREASAAAYDSVRGVYVLFGGSNATTQHLGDTWEWNGTEWRNPTPSTSPPGRAYHAMTYDAARGVTLLFGGSTDLVVAQDTWTWDGNDWTDVTPSPPLKSPQARQLSALVYDSQRGVDVLFGGGTGSLPLDDTWVWNGSTWSNVSPPMLPSPPARSEHSMAFDSLRGRTVLFGGCGGPDFQCQSKDNDTWEWDGMNWKEMTPTGASPSQRSDQSMAFDIRKGVTVMFGGANCNTGCTSLNDDWEWDGTAWTQQTPSGALPPPRIWAAMAYDSAQERSVVFGGQGPNSSYLGDTWFWDGSSSWTGGNPGMGPPPPRSGHMLSYDPIQATTLLFGGTSTGSTELGDTWTWDGSNWRNVTPPMGNPSTRSFSGIAWEATSLTTILFGGYGTNSIGLETDLGDTWQWNGTGWTQLSPNNSPSVRVHPAMAADGAVADIVLFGGFGGVTTYGDTWKWNPQLGNWVSQGTASSAPPGLSGAAIDYDSIGQQTVVFGGVDSTDTRGQETWDWSGLAWKDVGAPTPNSTNTPPPRDYAAMAYDSERERTVLFCGSGTASPFLDDYWEWSTALAEWTQYQIVTPPGANLAGRMLTGMVYDSSRGTLVLFGGDLTGSMPANDTWESPSDISRRSAGVATFDFNAAGATNPSIQSMTFEAWEGGNGPLGAGASVAVWDVLSGAWKSVQSIASGTSNPTLATYTTGSPAEAVNYIVLPSQTIHVAVYPSSGRGIGSTPPALALDGMDFTVRYQQ